MISDVKYNLCEEQVLGNAADEYTDDEVDFGVVTPNVNAAGNFGMHVVVTTTFTGLDSGANLAVVHGAATAPTTAHSSMFVPAASLVAGAHFFIPIGSTPLLRYVRGLFDIVSEVATAGEATIWLGPGPDGAND